jgi:hypothetical protein
MKINQSQLLKYVTKKKKKSIYYYYLSFYVFTTDYKDRQILMN